LFLILDYGSCFLSLLAILVVNTFPIFSAFFTYACNGVEGKLFSPSRKQHNNKESLATNLFKQLNFEQSCFKTVF